MADESTPQRYESSRENLQKWELSRFVVNALELSEWKCIPLLVLYCCDSAEANDITAVRHSGAVRSFSVICMLTEADILNGDVTVVRSVKSAAMIKAIFWSLHEIIQCISRMERK